VKLPRNIIGEELAKLLIGYRYKISHQTGSHVRLISTLKGTEHHITIPRHKPLKVGTLNSILNDVANYLEIDRSVLASELLEK
jgi:predicted RNA binding protein YcfA (HicA-like mRNA interferase family)